MVEPKAPQRDGLTAASGSWGAPEQGKGKVKVRTGWTQKHTHGSGLGTSHAQRSARKLVSQWEGFSKDIGYEAAWVPGTFKRLSSSYLADSTRLADLTVASNASGLSEFEKKHPTVGKLCLRFPSSSD